jgi:hypothetical protein
MTVSDRAAAIWIGVIAAAIYVAAGLGLATDYDYHGRLADAFLHGRWWLTEAPPWLNELLPCGDGRYCVVYPPLPALLSLPLVPFFPTAVAQVVASRIAGGASAGLLYYGLRAYGVPRSHALAGALLSAFGTTLFFSSVDGRAWFAAHSASMLFLAGAFAVAARGGNAIALGALIGLSALARLPVALAAPALALLCARRAGTPYGRSLAGVVAGGVPFAIVYVGYNLLSWIRAPHPGRRLLQSRALLAVLSAATALRDLSPGSRDRPEHALLPASALHRDGSVSHDAGVPLDLRRTSRDPS